MANTTVLKLMPNAGKIEKYLVKDENEMEEIMDTSFYRPKGSERKLSVRPLFNDKHMKDVVNSFILFNEGCIEVPANYNLVYIDKVIYGPIFVVHDDPETNKLTKMDDELVTKLEEVLVEMQEDSFNDVTRAFIDKEGLDRTRKLLKQATVMEAEDLAKEESKENDGE